MLFPEENDTTTASWQRWLRRLVVAVLILMSAAYITGTMADRWQDLSVSAFSLGALNWITLCAGTIGTLALSALYHVLLLRGIETHDVPATQIARAYVLGQIVRYIPGKIAGVAFQVGLLGGRVRAGSILLALLVQTVHDYAWAFAFCGVLAWALLSDSALPLLTFAPLILLLRTLHYSRMIERIIANLPILRAHMLPLPTLESKHASASAAILFLTWVPMLAAMPFAFSPVLNTHDALLAGLLYSIAAVISLAIIVVPSGLVVREAIFVWLGGNAGIPADTLLFVAVAARISMTIAEVITALMVVLLEACRRTHYRMQQHDA